MNSLRTTEVKLIGAILLAAGLYGFVVFATLVFPLNDLVNVLNIFPTSLFGMALYAGYLLLLKESPKGLGIARALVALQIIHFGIAGIEYLFVTGIYIFVGFSNLHFSMNFGLENTFQISFSDESNNFIFHVNILALFVFIYLTRVLDKLPED